MPDRSHDSGRLCAGWGTTPTRPPNRDNSTHNAAATAVPRAAQAAAAVRWRGWIERAGRAEPRTAVWTSRGGWLSALAEWSADAALFGRAAAAAGVSISPATLLAIATVMAAHADHATGRHVAITRARIAERVGCSVDTVTVAWRLLRAAGWALEAQRGHGGPTTPAVGRRPSVYHLVSRRHVAPGGDNPDLPAQPGSCLFSPVGTSSPSAHARDDATTNRGAGRRRYRAAPRPDRPLPLQRLAGQLAARCHGLPAMTERGEPIGGGHVGAICDALAAAGIDPAVWSARAITDALTADMLARGQSWPDRVHRPGAFLASRLRRLDWRPQERPKGGGCAATRLDKSRAADGVSVPATAAQRAAHLAEIRAALAAVRLRPPGAGAGRRESGVSQLRGAEPAPGGDRAPLRGVRAGFGVQCGARRGRSVAALGQAAQCGVCIGAYGVEQSADAVGGGAGVPAWSAIGVVVHAR